MSCHVRARRAARAPHNTRPSTNKERQGKEEKRRVVLDGGGARLADAATRHHLTPTQERKKKRSEQNKHQRTQTIQKTSTRTSTNDGHHTLPSMRNQTPIQQQRTTQTQLSRGRPHNPSLARRIQPSGQRKSPLRQMQQQTRQRTTRERKSTPLPEKRGRTKQTTRSSHANQAHQHMVNHPPPFQQQKKGGGQRRENTTRQTQWCSGITCVLAGLRAHHPEHQQERQKRKRRRQRRQATRPHTRTPRHSTTHKN